MKFIVTLSLLGMLLNSAYAVDFLRSDIEPEDVSHESSEVYHNRFSALVNTAMDLMEPEVQETESQENITAQTTY